LILVSKFAFIDNLYRRYRTGTLLRETAKLGDELEAVENRKRMVATFLVDYQLTDEEIAALKVRAALYRSRVFHAALTLFHALFIPYRLNAVDPPQLESAWFQPLKL
jgi:hypothetical protein